MADNTLSLSEKQINLILVVLLSITPIIGMGVDLITPSLPSMAINLHVTEASIKAIISIYLLGYALGNFITGILTDSFGRKNFIRLSLFMHAVVCLLPVIFPQLTILLLARFLQGFSIGAAAVLTRVILSDILPKQRIVRLGVLMGTMWALGPVFGPVIGGYLQFYLGWKACFYFFTIITFFCLIGVFFVVPETLVIRHRLNIKIIGGNIYQVITHKAFMAFPILMGISYSLIMVFHNAGPFLVQDIMHYSPVYFGHLSLYMGLSFMLATFACRFLLGKYSINYLYSYTIIISTAIAIIGVGLSYFMNNNIYLLIMISALMFFTTGFVYPMSIGKGISLFTNIAGTATAVMYLLNVLITSLMSFLISLINTKTTIPIMWLYLILMLIAVFVYFVMLHKDISNTSQ